MHYNPAREAAGGSPLTKSIDACSIFVAVLATFFVSAPVFSNTLPYIQNYTAYHYGTGAEQAIRIAWLILCGLGSFAVCRFVAALCFLMLSSKLFSKWL